MRGVDESESRNHDRQISTYMDYAQSTSWAPEFDMSGKGLNCKYLNVDFICFRA